MNDFIKSTNDLEDSITPNLFKEQKPFILIEISFCERNEKKSNDFCLKIS